MTQDHTRWNMTVNVLDVALFHFGLSFISLAVVFPALMSRLGASATVIALLPAIQILGGRLPQIATSYLAEMRPLQKRWCMWCGIFQRAPWLVLAGCLAFWGGTRPDFLIAAALVCLLVANVGYGFTAPAWGELIAKAIPAERRGLFMGLIQVIGNTLGVVGGFTVVAVMKTPRLEFPHNYAVLFALCAAVLAVSFLLLMLNRESPGVNHSTHASFSSYRKSLLVVLRNDHSFRWLLVHQSLSYSYVIGQGLFMAHALHAFSLGDEHTGVFVLSSTVAVLVVSPVLGWLGDRRGHRLVLMIASMAYVLAAATAAAAKDWRWMCAVFALLAVTLAGQVISTQNIVLQMAPAHRRPSYLALAATIPAPFVLGFALLGGRLAKSAPLGYRGAFLVSAGLSLAALAILMWRVRDTRPVVLQPFLDDASA
jgi:MFS family permease